MITDVILYVCDKCETVSPMGGNCIDCGDVLHKRTFIASPYKLCKCGNDIGSHIIKSGACLEYEHARTFDMCKCKRFEEA